MTLRRPPWLPRDPVVDAAVRACGRASWGAGSTVSWGARLIPAAPRDALTVVYAACKAGDDAVDEVDDPREARLRLAAWWDGVERAYAGAPDPARPAEVGLAWVLEHHPVPYASFVSLRRGFETDLQLGQLESVDALLSYARQVSGNVARMIAPIVGYRGGEATLQAGVALGEAMQLTNVLRDVGEDLARGRCYLPRDRMARHGVEVEALRAGVRPPGYHELSEGLARLAHARYRHAWHGIPRLRSGSATAAGLAALSYESILHKLRANRYDNLARRARVRGVERLALLPRAVLGAWGIAR